MAHRCYNLHSPWRTAFKYLWAVNSTIMVQIATWKARRESICRPFWLPFWSSLWQWEYYLRVTIFNHNWKWRHASKLVTEIWNDEYGSQHTPDRTFVFYIIILHHLCSPKYMLLLLEFRSSTTLLRLGKGFSTDWSCFHTSRNAIHFLDLESDFQYFIQEDLYVNIYSEGTSKIISSEALDKWHFLPKQVSY